MENKPTNSDHPLFAHQLEACRKAKAKADDELINGTLIRAGSRRRRIEEAHADAVASPQAPTIDFWAPSPLIDFSRNTTNFRIPTLTLVPVSKHGVPRGPNGETHPDYPDQRVQVEGHFTYIERQERADKTALGHHDYIVRPDARDADEEAGISHICTNISRNPKNRGAFIRAVYDCERKAKQHYLHAATDQLDWWAELAAEPGAEAWVREAANTLREAADEAASKGEEAKPFYVKIATVSERQAYDRITWAEKQPGWNPRRKNLIFKPGIGGRVQYRIVFDLPHWMTAAERLETVRMMARFLGKQGFMYVAAIHRPDGHNDSRNYHVHIDVYDRPCRYLKRFGCWDFEVQVKKKNGKIRYPYRRRKIAAFARSPDGSNHRAYGATVAAKLRQTFCDITNKVLEKNPSPLRYHPGPFEAIGLKLRPTAKLGGKRMANEAIGLRTDVGDKNARNIWADEMDAVNHRWERAKGELEAGLTSVESAAESKEDDAVSKKARAAQKDALEHLQTVRSFELAQVEIRVIRSRAETILRETKKRAAAQEKSGAFRKTALGAISEVARKEAEAHLAFIDSLAPPEAEIAAEAKALMQRGKELAERREVISRQAVAAVSEPKLVAAATTKRIAATKVFVALSTLREPAVAVLRTRFEEMEIRRPIAWLKEHQGDATRLTPAAGGIVIEAPQAVCSLLVKHVDKPSLRSALDAFIEAQTRDQQATPIMIQADPLGETAAPEAKAGLAREKLLHQPSGAEALRALSKGPQSLARPQNEISLAALAAKQKPGERSSSERKQEGQDRMRSLSEGPTVKAFQTPSASQRRSQDDTTAIPQETARTGDRVSDAQAAAAASPVRDPTAVEATPAREAEGRPSRPPQVGVEPGLQEAAGARMPGPPDAASEVKDEPASGADVPPDPDVEVHVLAAAHAARLGQRTR